MGGELVSNKSARNPLAGSRTRAETDGLPLDKYPPGLFPQDFDLFTFQGAPGPLGYIGNKVQ